ncbi:MAG: methyl-accepting chemotaxis protein [Granulosicoccus sp.]|nr:methyl-accepting chemotaxis protein [Granulosicoccus sp.]
MARSSDAAFPFSLVQDKSFQLRQIRRVLLLTVFFIVQSTLVLAFFYHTLLGEIVDGNAPIFFASEDIGNLNQVIPPMGSVLSKWVLLMLAINSVVTLSIGVYIIRRLSTPMLAMRRALNDIGNGNLDVQLRVDDSREFGELVDALNGALRTINEKIDDARNFSRVAETLEDQPMPDERAVRDALTQCNEVLRFFDSGNALDSDAPDVNKRAG